MHFAPRMIAGSLIAVIIAVLALGSTSSQAQPAAPGLSRLTPTPSTTFTPTSTLCPIPTPEPLFVEPVQSPTNALSQTIHVQAGNAMTVTVETEFGEWTEVGASPFAIEIGLMPNTTHHLTVTSYVPPINQNGCQFGNYSLSTTTDRNGSPLTIVHDESVTVTPTVTPSITPTATNTPTPCPTFTPEPLLVDPVLSPTDASTQTIHIQAGRAMTVTVTSEFGEWMEVGTSPFEIEIDLAAGQTQNLTVKADYPPLDSTLCGMYSLSTNRDRNGNLLTIAQTDSGSITATPTPTGTVTATPTLCPLPTPEPLFVEPVDSPTSGLTQTIYVQAGQAMTVTVETESGEWTEIGTSPFEIEIDLMPNTTHQLTVTSYIPEFNQAGCSYGGYLLRTTTDRNGDPLVIVQESATSFFWLPWIRK